MPERNDNQAALEEQIDTLERELEQARRTIAALELRNRAALELFDTARVLVVVLDTWGRIVRVNPFFEELTGYRSEEIAGKSWFDTFLPAPDRARIRAVFAKAVAEGRVHGNLNPIVTRDGCTIPVEWYASTLRDDDGEPIGVLSVGADVSERMQAQTTLRESEERYRALVEASPSAIAVIRDGKIGYVNRAGAKLFGYDDPTAAIGTQVLELIAPEHRAVFDERVRYLAEGLANPLIEVELLRRDGSRVIAESTSVPITLGGEPAALIIGRDISDRRRTEDALRRARQDWEDIFQAIGHPTVIMTADRRVLSANRATLELLDSDPEQIAGRYCYELFHGDGGPPEHCPLERLIDSGNLETEVMEMETLGGWYLISCTPVTDERGELRKIIHIATDITERKRAEDALKASEDRYRALVETSPDAIFLVDTRGQLLSINERATRLIGVASPAELIGKSFYDLVPPERRPQLAEALQEAISGGGDQTIKYEHVRSDGTAVVLEIHSAVFRDDEDLPVAVMGIARDVTAREQAARDLADSEARFRGTFEQAAVGIALAKPDGPFLRLNQRFCDVVGYTKEEMLGKTYMDITHPDDREPTKVFVEQAVAGEIDPPQMEKRYIRKDGSIVWINLTLSHVRDEDGELLYAIGISEDITERKLTEQKYRVVVENAGEAIVVAQDGMLKLANPETQQITGKSSEELLATPFIELIHPDDRTMVANRHQLRLGGEDPESVYSFRMLTDGDGVRWVEINAVLIEWEGRPATLNFLTDITERRAAEQLRAELEAQLRQSQKMEAIGQLAGGVAHDFNNLLSPILIYSDLLLGELSSKDPRREEIEQIRNAAAKAKDLTQQLLAFGRKQVLSMKVLDLNQVVTDLTRMLGRTLRENIDIELRLADAPLPFEGDLSQVEQILMNLAINARDAMPGGGTITITTEKVSIDADTARELRDVPPGHFALLTLSDTGHGMDERTAERVFEPFFSTKDRDKGTGLGLSTVYGIVKQHRGAIRVASAHGAGTTFEVYLPLHGRDHLSHTPAEATSEISGGSETLLFAEDEEAVRTTTCRLLEHLGYRVLGAADGPQALELAAAHDGPIDLLITDVIMPRMNGPELFRELRAARPDVPVLYVSGYTGEAIAEEGVLEPGIDYLPKPFTVAEIADKVREILDR